MPWVRINDPSTNTDGQVRSHQFIGSNTASPWHTGKIDQYNQTNRFLQNDKVRIAIEEPNRTDAVRSKMHISPTLTNDSETPAYYYLGETANLTLGVINTLVGHDFPGDTTSLGEAWIDLLVVDAQNNIIYQNGSISNNKEIDTNARIYRAAAGNHHDAIWPDHITAFGQQRESNILPSGKTDIVSYAFGIPAWTKSPLTISATLRYRKFSSQFSRWAFKNDNLELPIIDIARDAISVPIRIKHEIEQ